MSVDIKAIPRPWRQSASLLVTLATVIGTTLGAVAYASAGMRHVADEVVAPVQTDLDTYRRLEEERHRDTTRRLERLDEKLDRLLERTHQ